MFPLSGFEPSLVSLPLASVGVLEDEHIRPTEQPAKGGARIRAPSVGLVPHI